MDVSKFWTIVCVCLQVYSAFTAALQCTVCNGAYSLNDCTTTVNCRHDEVCFMSQVITTSLEIVFNAGCQTQNCSIKHIGSQGSLTACLRCCHDRDTCNTPLCGIKGSLPTSPTSTTTSNMTFAPIATLRTNVASTNSCRRCDLAPALSECTFVTCSLDEDCYIDEVITAMLTIRYRGGCRSKQACYGTAPAIGKRQELVACSRCCAGNNCNERLCGIRAITTTHNPGLTTQKMLQCRSCDHASALSQCSYALCFPEHEMCYMDQVITSTLTTVYYGGCRSKDQCSGTASAIGKRQELVACSQCCTWNDCNEHICRVPAIATTPNSGVTTPSMS